MKRFVLIAIAACLFVGCQEKEADAGQEVGCAPVVQACAPAPACGGYVESCRSHGFCRPVLFDGRIIRATRELLAPLSWRCRERTVIRRRGCY